MKDERPELLNQLGLLVRDAGVRTFDPGFADRVMERIHSEAEAPAIILSTSLRRQFFRLVPLAAGLILALSAYNLLGVGASAGQSLLDATLGLEPVTLESAYAFDTPLYSANDD